MVPPYGVDGWNVSPRRHDGHVSVADLGAVKAKLSLAERTYQCEACGLVLDRDVNAARNLLRLTASGAESGNACGGAVRPGTAGHAPSKQEPGTQDWGKTGTVPRQHGTAA